MDKKLRRKKIKAQKKKKKEDDELKDFLEKDPDQEDENESFNPDEDKTK